MTEASLGEKWGCQKSPVRLLSARQTNARGCHATGRRDAGRIAVNRDAIPKAAFTRSSTDTVDLSLTRGSMAEAHRSLGKC